MGYDFARSTRGPARLFGLLGLPDHNFSGRAGSGGCPTGPWVSPPSGKFMKVLQVFHRDSVLKNVLVDIQPNQHLWWTPKGFFSFRNFLIRNIAEIPPFILGRWVIQQYTVSPIGFSCEPAMFLSPIDEYGTAFDYGGKETEACSCV